jgi:hypothetical protein
MLDKPAQEPAALGEVGNIIDCDVHNSWTSAHVLEPYLDAFSRDYLARGE